MFCFSFPSGNQVKHTINNDAPQQLIDAYNNNIKVSDGRLLVLFLYNSKEEMRLLCMHPEMLQADTTHGTNNKNKELFTIASKDGNNKAFNACRAYIPNAQKWVFTKLFDSCLPIFFGKLICDRNQLLLTDGCTNEYVSFISTLGKFCVFFFAIIKIVFNIESCNIISNYE